MTALYGPSGGAVPSPNAVQGLSYWNEGAVSEVNPRGITYSGTTENFVFAIKVPTSLASGDCVRFQWTDAVTITAGGVEGTIRMRVGPNADLTDPVLFEYPFGSYFNVGESNNWYGYAVIDAAGVAGSVAGVLANTANGEAEVAPVVVNTVQDWYITFSVEFPDPGYEAMTLIGTSLVYRLVS